MEHKISLIFIFHVICCAFAEVLVTLPEGQIRGHILQTPTNLSFYAFQGIPYAKPPLGTLRFQAPEPAESWDGILNTTKDIGRCFSVAKNTDDETEDCLYINVYTTKLEEESDIKLPVMVFIFGGGFRDGASSYNVYGPDFLLEKDVVMVSFNYRVGPFGFLSTGDDVVPGNAGLKDQVLALKWTKQNIGLFGGNSSEITIFGQSAGAASVGYHILSKQSAGLFRAGIAESGSALNPWGFLDDPRPYAFELASKITNETLPDSSSTLLEFLQNVTAKEIDVASTQTVNYDRALPVLEVEHEGAFLTENMYESLEAGDINKIPLIIGINSEESLGNAKDLAALLEKFVKYDDYPELLIPSDMHVNDSSNESEVAAEIRKIYVDEGNEMRNNLGRSLGYISDNSYTRAIIKHAELQSNYTDVYFYQFSYKGPMGNNNITLEGADKVGHSEERPYYFRVQSSAYDNSDLSQFPISDVLTHYRMVKMWTDFAKTMNPTPEKSELLQNIIWPKVQPDNFQYMNIDADLEVKKDPKGERYLAWKAIYEKWGVRPFVTF
ncbi:cholinesterase 2-like [Anoplophora glabripennis]|uniref:cholinesterase 2-like n=1 Tax=Anoplophora glabripennis TaxID=217634 RepID=UPI00087361F1|nr:cholinesterase 2-like [Anoplophora glabripennis]